MVLTSLLGSKLLRTQRSHLPPVFRRYKSLTAAIERGRQGGPDRPFRPRTRAPPEQPQDANIKNRAQRRFERFGPPRDSNDASDFDDRPQRSRSERPSPSRSDAFGRVGAPRSRDERTRGFGGERDEGSFRSRDRPARRDGFPPRERRDDAASQRTRFADQKPSSGRFEHRDRSAFRGEEGRSQPRRFDREEGRSQPGRFDREERSPRRMDDSNTGGRRTFERSGRRSDTSFSPRESMRNGFDRGGGSTRPARSFGGRDEPSSYTRERPAKEQTERFGRHEAPQDGSGRSSYTADKTEAARGPESLPYTTAASEFIYGYSSVHAALRANRRKLYKIYIHSRGLNKDGLMGRIRAMKLFPITEEVGDEYMRAMDKASSGRPHNGVVLESSPLPVPPVTELQTTSIKDATFSVSIGSQSAEDALVNGKQELYPYKAASWRYPLVLYVDGVLDEGNLGAIARSAYFLGVDAIITPTRQTAPWSHIALKASAGAAEALPIFKISEPTDFLGKSARAGWRIYGSDAIPPPKSAVLDSEEASESNIIYTVARSTKRLPVGHCPVAEHPTILMMGAEGTGLRDSLLNLAHYKVGIRHGREVDEIGVDSLNVSVAASLLCNEMLQKPSKAPAVDAEEVLF